VTAPTGRRKTGKEKRKKKHGDPRPAVRELPCTLPAMCLTARSGCPAVLIDVVMYRAVHRIDQNSQSRGKKRGNLRPHPSSIARSFARLSFARLFARLILPAAGGATNGVSLGAGRG
jgi:hypothetical protein